MKKIKLYIYYISFITTPIFAQENKSFHFNIINTDEAQYNITEPKVKGVGLLELETSFSTDKYWKNGLFEFNMWAILEVPVHHHIAKDILTFSNIEADNNFICSKLGYQHTIKNLSLFIGIRSLSFDYFTTDYSSLFTNSSAGMLPTISLNQGGIANYPLSALGIHAEYNTKNISIKNSFYNNLNEINKRAVFKFQFNPQKYGYTNFTEVMYKSPSGNYSIGSSFEKLPEESINGSFFGLIEQSVVKSGKTELGVIGQLGYAPKSRNYCHSYWGIGSILTGLIKSEDKDNLGLIIYSAEMESNRETGMELTYEYPITPNITLQPTLHYINNDETNSVLGLLRATFTFGN